MESSMGIEMGLLDLDLLQLPDLPSSPSPSSSSTSPKHSLSHARLDDLFAQWLSLPDTQRLVMSLLEEAKSAGSSSVAQVSSSVSVSLLPGVFKEGSTPPLSPKSSPLSPRSPMRRSGSGPTNLSSPLRKSSDPLREVIPQVSHRLALVMHTMQYTTLCRLQKKWTLFLFLSFLVFLITMLILWVCLCFSVLGGHLFLGDNLC
jgi:hypothetical protein